MLNNVFKISYWIINPCISAFGVQYTKPKEKEKENNNDNNFKQSLCITTQFTV